MATPVIVASPERERRVGRVVTPLVIHNEGDVYLAEAGHLPKEQIRTVLLDEVLVDTGASTLCLPSSIVAELGLRRSREVTVHTANGRASAWIYRDATITVMGRSGTFECIELPDE